MNGYSFEKTWIPFTQGCFNCAKFGWNWPKGSGEGNFLIISMYFCYFVIISHWKRAGSSFEQTWIPSKCVISLVKIGDMVLVEIFLIVSIYFHYFFITSPWKKVWPFIWSILNPLHPRKLCAKFNWNWASGFGEDDENVNSLQTDGQTDGQQAIRKAHVS